MVKADLSRDYYGDLGLQSGADIADIKKQFKKLALTYHPDRNPGKESEVTAKFQLIQSAHEVLTDAQERAKYDANRTRASYKPSYSGGTASGVRGNPWSNAGSQWAPPPKPPTARNRAPPPSAGARNYDKFKAHYPSAQQSHFEGAEARAKQYEAWERMRAHDTPKPNQSRPVPKPPPPPRNPPKPAADYRKPAPRPYSGFDDSRDATPESSPHRRSASTNASTRKGFMPTTPGGDEPAAPKGNYFTMRTARAEPPPRDPAASDWVPDPLRPFRNVPSEEKIPNLEKRYTPYATHGGEKLDPFETANLNRSRSTRDPLGKSASKNVPRAGSDPDLSSSRRSRTKSHPASFQVESDSSDEDSGPQTNGNAFGSSRTSTRRSSGAPPRGTQAPNAAEASTHSRKPSKLRQFQQWMKENPGKEPNVDSWVPDGPPLRSQPQNKAPQDPNKMYDTFTFHFGPKPTSKYPIKPPTVSDKHTANPRSRAEQNEEAFKLYKYFKRFCEEESATAPSGIARETHPLNAFEGLQREIVDGLLSNKFDSRSRPNSSNSSSAKQIPQNSKPPTRSQSNQWHDARAQGSPSKTSKPSRSFSSAYLQQRYQAHYPASNITLNRNANYSNLSSFSFSVDDNTFERTKPRSNGFTSSSAENISTTFAAEDWAGKFEAGADFLQPEAGKTKMPPPPRGRAQSTSRSRGRSPTKVSTAPKFTQPAEPEEPVESPRGTKFSAEEWAQYFKPGKPGLFEPMPNSASRTSTSRKPTRGSVARPTMGGKAAVVDEGETPDEKPLFDGAKSAGSSTPYVPSPDAMDVDTPPATHTVPQFADKPPVNTTTTKTKRPAGGPSQPASPAPGADTEALKVNFADLQIKDLISSLDLPVPPKPPKPPTTPAQSFTIYQKAFAKYMGEWDELNKRYLLHVVARKNQVDALGARRWEDEDGANFYRRGLKEDGVVSRAWQEAREGHERDVTEFLVVEEKMRSREEAAASPRKKTR